MRNGHTNGHALEQMPTTDEHRMHQYLRRARAALSPDTAPELDEVSSGPVPASIAAACIDEDVADVKQQLKAIADELKIEEGDSAATICDRLRAAIDEKLALLAEGRIKDTKISVTPTRKDVLGRDLPGCKIIVTTYFG